MGKWGWALVILAIVVGIGGGAWWLLSPAPGDEAPEVEEE